ncbi:hypothetical protein GCM10007857_76640 [Bradyrhizobium iriomotense]|uniref:DNA-binding protein n=1 Tax=Bradyrhizobium iriomotense TaxID=441950 RepID=A0ABQ6BAZ1_9BRAD|nr:hypothetical protein GCM10007857_76640 [Bradyrhizobium iriomotense]
MKPESPERAPRIGWTIAAFARAVDVPEHVIRRACRRGDIATVRFAGRDRIKRGEAQRIRALLELDEPEH